jgi:hypothetical protein
MLLFGYGKGDWCMAKVTFEASGAGSYVMIDGVMKAHITSGPECYISIVTGDKPWIECKWAERHTIARFKYNKPKTKAKAWCKTVFTKLTPARVHELLVADHNGRLTPHELGLMVEDGRLSA